MTPEQRADRDKSIAFYIVTRFSTTSTYAQNEAIKEVASALKAARLSAAKAMQEQCARKIERLDNSQMTQDRAAAAIRDLNPEEDSDAEAWV